MEIQLSTRRKTLVNFIADVSSNYFIAKRKLNEGTIKDIESNNEYLSFVKRVERAFEQLTDIEKQFINNEFFFEAYPNWWKKDYSRSSYYKIRRKSMKSFKEAFDYGA